MTLYRHVIITNRGHTPCTQAETLTKLKQESIAIAKMTAWCALTLILFTLTTSSSLYFERILILNEFKLRKFSLFLQEWRFGRRSRSSEVIDFGANRKRVCDFLLVRNSNLGPILHHFRDLTSFMCSWPHPYSTLILGVFPLRHIAHVGRQRAHGP